MPALRDFPGSFLAGDLRHLHRQHNCDEPAVPAICLCCSPFQGEYGRFRGPGTDGHESGLSRPMRSIIGVSFFNSFFF